PSRPQTPRTPQPPSHLPERRAQLQQPDLPVQSPLSLTPRLITVLQFPDLSLRLSQPELIAPKLDASVQDRQRRSSLPLLPRRTLSDRPLRIAQDGPIEVVLDVLLERREHGHSSRES